MVLLIALLGLGVRQRAQEASAGNGASADGAGQAASDEEEVVDAEVVDDEKS